MTQTNNMQGGGQSAGIANIQETAMNIVYTVASIQTVCRFSLKRKKGVFR